MSLDHPIIILLIAIPSFFLLRFFLKRFIKNDKVRIWTSAIATLILGIAVYIGLVSALFSYLFYEPQLDFNKEKWDTDKKSRFEMRDDIVESEILIGKSKSEIIEFIGKPEFNDSTDVWNYNLGMSGAGLGWQFNSLEVSFENGKVSKVKKNEIVD